MLFEKVAGQGENIEKTWKIGEILSLSEIPTQSGRQRNNIFFTFTKKLQLVSQGDVQNKMSKTLVDEKEYSLFHRGLNFVVVNDKFQVIETTYIDTYDETSHAFF